MNLAEWRAHRQRTETVTLPSGLEVVLRPVAVQDLVVQGRIPDTLYSTIDDLAGKGGNGAQRTVSDVAGVAKVALIVCRAAIVEPGELDAEELPTADRIFIFNWANQEAAQLATFPEKRPGGSLDAASNGAGVRGEAIQPA